MDDIALFSATGDRYAEELARGLKLTGESAEYFARHRIARVRELTCGAGLDVRGILDFGCGTGSSFALLRAAFPSARVLGFEPADGLRALAERAATAAGAEVVRGSTLTLSAAVDIVYCNGVFHHIPRGERDTAMAAVARALRPGGLACVWENSPYNPGTRVIMSRVPFDRGAVLLQPRELRARLRDARLAPERTEYHFVFPRILRFARPLEALVRSLPLGGQYVVTARRA